MLRLAELAGPGGRLAAVERRPNVVAEVAGERANFTAPGGAYAFYALGSATNRLGLEVDGKPVGSVSFLRNPDGQFLEFGEALIGDGAHVATLTLDGQSAAPGSGAPTEPVGPLVLDPNPPRLDVTYVPTARARDLCGRHLDWVEALP